MITLITMSQGNPLALKRTLDSFAPYVDEVVFGDMLVFNQDRAIIETYGMKIVPTEFNFIFKNGFAATLNHLASHASNDWCIYMNVGEVIESIHQTDRNPFWELPESLSMAYRKNCYCFDHATDTHKWFRMYDRTKLEWAGIIHEELVGGKQPYDAPIFRMADTHKDAQPFAAKVYNDIKELVYFKQYLRLVDEPGIIGITNQGWVAYAKRDYAYIKERMEAKGLRLQAFETGDLQLYLSEIYQPNFTEEFEDSDIIHFQK